MRTDLTFSNVVDRLFDHSVDVWDIHDRGLALKQAGEDVHMLCVGDTDLCTPQAVIDQAVKSLNTGRTHYAPGAGEPALRKAIAEIETERTGKACNAEEVLIYPGATHGLYSILSCLLNPGDELVVIEPMYLGYHGIFEAVGADVVTVSLETDQNFQLDVDKLKAAISERTKVLLLNTPGNPAGNMIPASALKDLAQYCHERNIWLISDEVYSRITYEEPHTPIRQVADDLDNLIVINSLSKSYAMTGWRIGWCVAPAHVIEKLTEFSSSIIFGCVPFVQDAAIVALQRDAEHIGAIRDEYRKRRDYVYERINAMPGLKCNLPMAGIFLMVDVSAVADSGHSFAEALIEEQMVSVLPGEGFGSSTKDFIRISLARDVPTLGKAMDRIEAYINSASA